MSLLIKTNKVPLILTDNGEYVLWRRAFIEFCGGCGAPGKAIARSDNNDHPIYPAMTDMLLDRNGNTTSIQRFDHKPASGSDPAEFINDGLKEFKRAVERYPSAVENFEKNGNGQITDYLASYISSDIKKSLATNVVWMDACTKQVTDNFRKFAVIEKLYSHGTGKSKNRKLFEFVTTTQNDDSYADYVENINNGEMTTLANFGSNLHPGFIAVADLKAATFLNGLNTVKFQFLLDKFYVDNPTGKVADLDKLMADTAIYSREHRVEAKTSDNYSVSLVATSKTVLCTNCRVPIPYTLSHKGSPYTRCSPCYKDMLSKLKTAKATKYDKPGPLVPKQTSTEKTSARAQVASVAKDPTTVAPKTRLSASPTSIHDDDTFFLITRQLFTILCLYYYVRNIYMNANKTTLTITMRRLRKEERESQREDGVNPVLCPLTRLRLSPGNTVSVVFSGICVKEE